MNNSGSPKKTKIKILRKKAHQEIRRTKKNFPRNPFFSISRSKQRCDLCASMFKLAVQLNVGVRTSATL